jgi:heat shock protein HtpX
LLPLSSTAQAEGNDVQRFFLVVATSVSLMALPLLLCLPLMALFHLAPSKVGLVALTGCLTGMFFACATLLLARPLAKWKTRFRVIEQPADELDRWLVETVASFAGRAGIPAPSVAKFMGRPNAFSVGVSSNRAVVVVSDELVHSLGREELAAVLAHEVAHIATGDMVTLTLLQGISTGPVVVLASLLGWFVDATLDAGESTMEEQTGSGAFLIALLWQLFFGHLASLVVPWFSRRRELRADQVAVRLGASPSALELALQTLGRGAGAEVPAFLSSAAFLGAPRYLPVFNTHPPLDERLAALSGLAATT